jgi:hypothetical protein
MSEPRIERITPAFIDASAGVLGLEIRPEWRENVLANMVTLGAAADLVGAVPLGDEIEAAPIFTA